MVDQVLQDHPVLRDKWVNLVFQARKVKKVQMVRRDKLEILEIEGLKVYKVIQVEVVLKALKENEEMLDYKEMLVAKANKVQLEVRGKLVG